MWPEAACRPISSRLWARWCGALPPPRSYATATAQRGNDLISLRYPPHRRKLPSLSEGRTMTDGEKTARVTLGELRSLSSRLRHLVGEFSEQSRLRSAC